MPGPCARQLGARNEDMAPDRTAVCVVAQLEPCTKVPGPLGGKGGWRMKFIWRSTHKSWPWPWLHPRKVFFYWPSHIDEAAANQRGKDFTNWPKPVDRLTGSLTQPQRQPEKQTITMTRGSTEEDAATESYMTQRRGHVAVHAATFRLE